MRESRTFAERTTVLKTDEVQKRYFLIIEGASTEKNLALRNAEKFCQNEVLFISEVGTNIVILILLLKGEDCKVQTSHKF